MKAEIIKWLKSQSPEQRWHNNGMGDYLDSNRWKIVKYEQDLDMNTGDETNVRIWGLSGASADGKQSGQIRVVSDPADEIVHSITPVVPKGKLTAAQHDFIALTRGEAQWLMDDNREPPKPGVSHPDFGSW